MNKLLNGKLGEFYCIDCRMAFNSANDKEQHETSSKHVEITKQKKEWISCGKIALKKHQKTITVAFAKVFKSYFKISLIINEWSPDNNISATYL